MTSRPSSTPLLGSLRQLELSPQGLRQERCWPLASARCRDGEKASAHSQGEVLEGRGVHSQGQGQRGGRREAEKFGEISVTSKAKLRTWKAASMALAEGQATGA